MAQELKAHRFWDLDEIRRTDANVGSLYYLKSEADKVIAHHKHKRCLAMAKWCRISAQCDKVLGVFKYRDWYWKWFKRWLELAEKFKEAK